MPRRRTVWDHNEMGVFFYGRGAYDLAISEFTRALRAALIPMPALHVNLGAAYLGKKMYAEAEASLRRGLGMDPGSQSGHVLLARLLLATGRTREAVTEFERARAIDPETPQGREAREELRGLRATPSVSGTPRRTDSPKGRDHAAPTA